MFNRPVFKNIPVVRESINPQIIRANEILPWFWINESGALFASVYGELSTAFLKLETEYDGIPFTILETQVPGHFVTGFIYSNRTKLRWHMYDGDENTMASASFAMV